MRRLLPLIGVVAVAVLAVTSATAAGLDVSSQLLAAFASDGGVATTRCEPPPAADTHVDEAAPSTNSGDATTIIVRSESGKNKRVLARFDVSSCSIPQGASVESSLLQLYTSNAPDSDRTHDVFRVTGSWTEGGVTWDTQPTAADTATDSISTGTTHGVWLEWTVTADVAAFVDGSAANEGWLVRDANEGALVLGEQADISSREHATSAEHPVLVIEYYP